MNGAVWILRKPCLLKKKKKKDLNILNVFYISEQYCHT